MPRLPAPPDPLIEYAIARWAEFRDPSAWRRSRRGNLWRTWDGANVTVFQRPDGWYGWCVSDEDGARFSPRGYAAERDATDAAGEALYVGEI